MEPRGAINPKCSPLKTWWLFPVPSEKLIHVKDALEGRGKLKNLQELVRALVSQVSQECRVPPPKKSMFLPLFYSTNISSQRLSWPGPIRGSHR